MTLADFTREELCLPDLLGAEPTAVLCELSRALERAQVVPSSLSLIDLSLNHYFLGEADTIGAVACVMVRLPSLHETVLAVGRKASALAWRAGGPAVKLVFLVAGPSTEPLVHPVMLAGIRRLAGDALALDRILAAAHATQMLNVLARVDLGPPIQGAESAAPGSLREMAGSERLNG